jgi:phosphomannomutase
MNMRAVPLFSAVLLCAASATAAGIREFSVPTLERLGNELTRASQRPDRGASDPIRKRAKETALAALKGKLFDARYDYVVLNDPDGKRLLVYALASPQSSTGVVLAGHFRVTVSADGSKAERVDALSKTFASSGPMPADAVALYLIQLVSNKPVETLIYTANLAKKPIYVGTPDGKSWIVGDGKMKIVRSKPGDKSEPRPQSLKK